MDKPEFPQEESVRYLVGEFEKQDRENRFILVKDWKYASLFWDGLQTIWWDAQALDYRPMGQENFGYDPNLGAEGDELPWTVNVYRPYGESIAAALSTDIPQTRFFPENADDPDDILTANAFERGSKIVMIHNDPRILLMRALYCMYNFGIFFIYNYNKRDKKFGLYEKPKYETVLLDHFTAECPLCGFSAESEVQPPEGTMCPQCAQGGMQQDPMQEQDPSMMQGQQVPLIISAGQKAVEKLVDLDLEEKTREIIEVHSPMNVKIPVYARKQEDVPYLIQEFEQHFSTMRKIYPEFWDDIQPTGSLEEYNRWARTPNRGVTWPETGLVTVRKCWFRPSAYGVLKSAEEAAELEKEFPNGLYAVFIGQTLVEVLDDNLDDHWTISENPLSEHIHATPLGREMLSIQEIRNEMLNIEVQTAEHGIPQVFADPKVLNFDKYSQMAIKPGTVFPAQPIPGQTLEQAFSVVKTASFSEEIGRMMEQLDRDAQFITGAVPSIWGGAQQGGTNTAFEYKSSKDQALQRLSLYWYIVQNAWSKMTGKATKSYIQNLVGDEDGVSIPNGGTFASLMVSRAETYGKIGRIVPETTNQFPTSWEEKRQVLFNLLSTNVQQFIETIFHPENIEKVGQLIGLDDLFIPGKDQRNKQLLEISDLLQGVPVMIDPILDAAPIHIEVCRAFLLSDIGENMKRINPTGYQAVYQHLMEHTQFVQQQEMQQPQPEGAPPQNQGEQVNG